MTVPVMVSKVKTLASDGVEVCSGKDGGGRRHRETRVQVMIIQGRIKKIGRWLALNRFNVATFGTTSRRSRE